MHGRTQAHTDSPKTEYLGRLIAGEDITSRSAIAAKPRCSVCKLWQKYKCEKRATNIALSYGVDVDK